MKRILYVFALLAVSAFAAEAQQRVVIGTMDKPDTYLLKPGTNVTAVEQTMIPLDNDGKHALPVSILADTTFRYAMTVRVHPFPAAGEPDTTRILTSVTNPDSSRFIGEFFTGVKLPNYTFNGFSQFVPFNFYQPELSKGSFTIDSILFFLYPANGPVTTDMEVWIVAIPQKYNGTSYKGYNFDIDNTPGIEFISEGPIVTMTADSINAHLENNTIRPTILDLQQYNKNLRTVATDKMWGIILLKPDRSNPDQLAMIGTHEWTLPSNQTFGGIVGHTQSGIDSVVALWKPGYRWTLSTESYPAYANQSWKINYRMNFYGEFTGELQTGVEQESNTANSFALEQNVPNPALGEVKINFSVAQNSNVTLRVYNTLGQQVAELANGNYGVGKYNATFNTESLPNGSYVYVLNANGQTMSRTLQVVR